MKDETQSLKSARKRSGFTQEQVAILLGVKVRSYQRYESGERTPSLKMCAKLEQLFNVPIIELFNRQSTTVESVR